MLLTRDRVAKISIAVNDLFPQRWLDAKANNDPRGRTNREVQLEVSIMAVILLADFNDSLM